MEITGDWRPHGVEDKIDAFTPREFCCWHKISVSGYEHDLIHLFLVGYRCEIDADSHVCAFLPYVVNKIRVGQCVKSTLPLE